MRRLCPGEAYERHEPRRRNHTIAVPTPPSSRSGHAPDTAAPRRRISKIIKVLLVEDSRGDARLIQEYLTEVEGLHFEVENADRLATGVARLGREGIDVILLDLSLPDSRGLDTFLQFHAAAPGVPIVVLTGFNDEVLAVNAVQAGAEDYLVKGHVNSNLLARSLRYAIERTRRRTAKHASAPRKRKLPWPARFNKNCSPRWLRPCPVTKLPAHRSPRTPPAATISITCASLTAAWASLSAT